MSDEKIHNPDLNVTAGSADSEEYEEISSDEVDRVVESLSPLEPELIATNMSRDQEDKLRELFAVD